MEKFMPILKRSKLFAGVGEDEIGAMLGCLQVVARSYKKGEYVFRQGQNLQQIIVLGEADSFVLNVGAEENQNQRNNGCGQRNGEVGAELVLHRTALTVTSCNRCIRNERKVVTKHRTAHNSADTERYTKTGTCCNCDTDWRNQSDCSHRSTHCKGNKTAYNK